MDSPANALATARHELSQTGSSQPMVLHTRAVGTVDDTTPILLLADGDLLFTPAVGIAQLLLMGRALPGLIVAAVSYKELPFGQMMQQRVGDLTPSEDLDYLASLVGTDLELPEHIRLGGGLAYLDAVASEVMPMLGSAEVLAGRVTLAGYSLSGLLACHNLFAPRCEVANYLLISPSLWWRRGEIFELAAAGEMDERTKVFFGVGELEEGAPGSNDAARMVTNVSRLATLLQQKRNSPEQITAQIFAGENHASVVGAALTRGIRVLLTE